MMKITAHACTSGHWEMLSNCPLLQRSLSSLPRSTSEAFLIPHSASVTQVPCPTLLTSGVLHYLFSCFCTPPKKKINPEPTSCPIGPTLLCPEREIIKIVTSFFQLVGGIWCGERSIIYGVFDLASCLSCKSMSSLHISGLCSECISLMAMYTHTCTHASALP